MRFLDGLRCFLFWLHRGLCCAGRVHFEEGLRGLRLHPLLLTLTGLSFLGQSGPNWICSVRDLRQSAAKRREQKHGPLSIDRSLGQL